jgi:phage terminase large subunit-like protein
MSAAAVPTQNFSFDAARAQRVVKFIERICCHTKDQWSGQPFLLEPWQKEEIIEPLFGWVRADGTRKHRTAYISMGRKNGKSELGAAIALYLTFADGVEGAEIYSAAKDRDQASLVFDVAADMVEMSPILSRRAKVLRATKRIIDLQTRSIYRAISADAKSKHGYNASGVIFDELHTQPNRELWDVLRTSKGARLQPLIVALTTAGYDQTSICYEQYRYGKDVQRGVKADPSYFYFCREAPADADWTDEEVWKIANPGLGKFLSLDSMREECELAKNLPSYQNTFRNLYLNQWVQQQTRAIDLAAWDACAVETLPDLSGVQSFGGLDLSETTDLTAFSLVTVFKAPFELGPEFEGKTLRAIENWFWLPSEPSVIERARREGVDYDAWAASGHVRLCPGKVVDYNQVIHEIGEICVGRNLQCIAFDRWGSLGVWKALEAAGHKVVQFGQGYASMSAPCKELLSSIVGGNVVHANDPVMRWMIDCVETAGDGAGNIKFVKPDRHKSRKRIDGVIASVMALAQSMGAKPAAKSIFSEEVFNQWHS